MDKETLPTPTFRVHSLGCKANFSDGDELIRSLKAKGWTQARSGGADPTICIVNSCSVTDEADKQSYKFARDFKKRHPDSHLVFTGCGAEVAPDEAIEKSGADFVVGNSNKNTLLQLVLREIGPALTVQKEIVKQGKILGGVQSYAEMKSSHPMDRDWPVLENTGFTDLAKSSRTRAFLKIQEGCDAFCTYCIIPYGRGPSRCLSSEAVIDSIKRVVAQGFREVILTATNLGDYPDLEGLLRKILAETEVERIRLSSLDPSEISSSLIAMVDKEPRICAHFHVSLQSPHQDILKRMKRQYGTEAVVKCLDAIASASSKIFVGMDVITGFPGESDEDFEWTYRFLENHAWDRLHVFPYSERSRTPATKLQNSVYPHVRHERAKRLRALSFERLQKSHQAQLGKKFDVLMESPVQINGIEYGSGHASNYFRCLIPKEPPKESNDRESGSNSRRLVRAVDLKLDPAQGDVAFICQPCEP